MRPAVCILILQKLTRPLTAKVVDFVVSKVFFVEELADVSDGISVERLAATGRERHRDDTLRDVGQIEVKSLPLVATLVL